jgi:hypothetical protein
MWPTRQINGPNHHRRQLPVRVCNDIGGNIVSIQIGMAQLQLDNNAIARIADEALNDQSRVLSDDAQIDLWGKTKLPLPGTAVPVLVQEVFFQVEWFDQVIWFNRDEHRDELWVFTGLETDIPTGLREQPPLARKSYLYHFGSEATCAISVPRSRPFDESLVELLSIFISAAAGSLYGIERVLATGHVNKAHLRTLWKCLESYRERKHIEHEEFSRQARDNETEIIRVARELGLHPEPAGTSPTQWYARCPVRRGHRLVNGGVDELRSLVAKGVDHVHLA